MVKVGYDWYFVPSCTGLKRVENETQKANSVFFITESEVAVTNLVFFKF